jgi:hypothetical protein
MFTSTAVVLPKMTQMQSTYTGMLQLHVIPRFIIPQSTFPVVQR